jgi:replicative DNA helicase
VPGPPFTPEAEKSVLAQMMVGGSRVAGQVIGTLLEPGDFFSAPHRAVYEQIYSNYYKDAPIDVITIAESASERLGNLWGTEDTTQIVTRVKALVENATTGNVVDHAKIIKQKSDLRKLQQVAANLMTQVDEGEKTPQEIGADASHEAMQVATSTLLTTDILSFADLGRRYVKVAEAEMQARAEGKELGAHFGLNFIDNWTRGVRPTELWIMGGEPGAGKSAVSWNAALRFAERQARNPKHEQVGCFVLSLEMGETDSEVRMAQGLTKIDGAKLREARQNRADLQAIINQWGRRKDIPLYFNFASTLRASQLRALCVEAIRRHNCGLIVIDHFRYFDLDHRLRDGIQEDEEKARFLKEDIAKDLNVAVICLAHTTKAIESSNDRRPTLSHLRGSGLVAAHADFVSFVYRPFMYASEQAKNVGQVFDTDAEMIFRKNRHGVDGISEFYFEPHTMTVSDPK